MDDNQLALIAQGQAYKRLGGAATPWTVASHFTIFNYRMDVPLDTKEAAFTALDAPITDKNNRQDSNAQFNRYDIGGLSGEKLMRLYRAIASPQTSHTER